MNKKKLFFKILPYAISTCVGIIFFLISVFFDNNTQNLLINVSSSFISIPLIFLFYKIIDDFSKKQLNYEILEYSKIMVDKEILSIINQLQKLIYPLNKRDSSLEGINAFLLLKGEDIKKIIMNNEYLGFQVFKHWIISQDKITELLKHPLTAVKMDNELIICIISVLKHIYSLEQVLSIKDLYIETGRVNKGYKIVKGADFDKDNKNYPDRYLLLKILKDDKYLVSDFGDIHKYNEEKSLKIYTVNPIYYEILSNTIFKIIEDFRCWGTQTGKEFIIDSREFRLVYVKNPEKIRKFF